MGTDWLRPQAQPPRLQGPNDRPNNVGWSIDASNRLPLAPLDRIESTRAIAVVAHVCMTGLDHSPPNRSPTRHRTPPAAARPIPIRQTAPDAAGGAVYAAACAKGNGPSHGDPPLLPRWLWPSPNCHTNASNGSHPILACAARARSTCGKWVERKVE